MRQAGSKPGHAKTKGVNTMRQYPETWIKETPCRNDGNLHHYALYVNAEGDNCEWIFAWSESAYNPGETVELEDGRTAHIDIVIY